MVHKETVNTRIEDFDQTGHMTPSAILKIFENAGSHHSDQAMDSVLDESLKGIAWLLTEWEVEIDRLPTYRDRLSIETWIVGEAPSIRAYRELLLKDAAGTVLVKARASFALFSQSEKKVIQVSKELMEQYQPEHRSVFNHKPSRLTAPKEWDSELGISIRKSDIDYNGHVHNTDYLDFALELFSEEYESIRSFCIVYKASLKYGDTVVVKCAQEQDAKRFSIISNDKPYTLLEIKCCEGNENLI